MMRFSHHCLPPHCADEVYHEYRAYQCLPTLPQEVISATGIDGGTELRPDTLWHNVEEVKDVKVWLACSNCKLILTFLRSNADEERIFSLVSNNKTIFVQICHLSQHYQVFVIRSALNSNHQMVR